MSTETDLNLFIMMGSLFVGYLLGVRVLEVITARLRSIKFIKSVHTIVFVPLSGLLFVLVYEVAVDTITYWTYSAIAIFLAETVVLATNNWRCPLTKYAERLGSTHGQITDFFFPKWFADRVFLVYGGLFTLSLALVLVRQMI
jgi:hypothetical protein